MGSENNEEEYPIFSWPHTQDLISSEQPLMENDIDNFFYEKNRVRDINDELDMKELSCDETINLSEIEKEAYCVREKEKIQQQMIQDNKRRRRGEFHGILSAQTPTESDLLEYNCALCFPLQKSTQLKDIPQVTALTDSAHSYSVDIHGSPVVPYLWTSIHMDLYVGTNIFITKNGLYSNFHMGPGAFLFTERVVYSEEDAHQIQVRTVADIIKYFPDGLLSKIQKIPGEQMGNVHVFIHAGIRHKIDYIQGIPFFWIVCITANIVPANTRFVINHNI